MESYIVISTTTDTRESARNLAAILLKDKRAACVQIIPDIESYYQWENKLKVESEFLLLIKTAESQKNHVIEIVKRTHLYSTAEVISHQIDILDENYRKWFKSSMET